MGLASVPVCEAIARPKRCHRKPKSMRGIVGYIGRRDAVGFLIEGLRRLEYRGYDTPAWPRYGGGRLQVTKSAGRIDALVEKLGRHPIAGDIGIGHTRWATHGPATDVNAHPHLGGDGEVAVSTTA